jgi:hypothetical protein
VYVCIYSGGRNVYLLSRISNFDDLHLCSKSYCLLLGNLHMFRRSLLIDEYASYKLYSLCNHCCFIVSKMVILIERGIFFFISFVQNIFCSSKCSTSYMWETFRNACKLCYKISIIFVINHTWKCWQLWINTAISDLMKIHSTFLGLFHGYR